ncbi:MAG: FUSC family protein [Porticoccaceae bacterium]|jgi:uncharacterized membrane protein YccC
MIAIGRQQILFSLKLFVAGMIAFAIVVKLGSPQPYWALVTCCVVMNPVTGAIRSKAAYRFAGTLGAGVAALFMVGLLASTPLLLVIISGLLATLAFYLALLDRSPRSYGFQLFGITVMLVAVAWVDKPDLMFDMATARVLEISIGILVCGIVDSVIAPRSLDSVLRSSLHRWLPDMQNWIEATLEASAGGTHSHHDRLRTLSDISQLSQLAAQLRYDPTVSRSDLRHALAIQQRLLRIIPLLSELQLRLEGLDPSQRAQLQPSLELTQVAITAGSAAPPRLAQRIRALPGTTQNTTESTWAVLIHHDVADLTEQLVDLWHEVVVIDRALDGTASLVPALARDVDETPLVTPPPDTGLALRIAASILTTYALLCGLWWATGWEQGANATLIGTVALGFFGGVDEPGRAIALFGRSALLAMVLVGGLCYGLLPLANDFPTFVLVMGLFTLPLGVWGATNPMAILMLAFGLSSINLQGHYAPYDFAFFLDYGLGSLTGIFVALVCAGLFRTLGAEHALLRLMRMESEATIRLSRSASPRTQQAHIARTLDRLASMTLRLAAPGKTELSASLLKRMSIGANVAGLRIWADAQSAEYRRTADRLLRRLREDVDRETPSAALLALIDQTLDVLWHHRDSAVPTRALVGLRMALFEKAPAWVPAT